MQIKKVVCVLFLFATMGMSNVGVAGELQRFVIGDAEAPFGDATHDIVVN